MDSVTMLIIYAIGFVLTPIITYYTIFSPPLFSDKEYKSNVKVGAIFYGMIWPMTVFVKIVEFINNKKK